MCGANTVGRRIGGKCSIWYRFFIAAPPRPQQKHYPRLIMAAGVATFYELTGMLRLAADLTVVVHFAFIIFVIFGALLVRKYPGLKYAHWVSLGYGLLVEVFNWYCPLTLLEQYLRDRGGRHAYDRSFLVHYLDRLIYWDVPQWVLIAGAAVVAALNIVFYWRTGRRTI